ncbi:MAG TPA: hypothetical protein VFI62_18535, partial [Burkholderiales bacterium]|nr:hypothetical protein [Burkholderiales bacterium]
MFGFLKPKPRPEPTPPRVEAESASTPTTAPSSTPVETPQSGGWFNRLKQGLSKTRRQFGGRLVSVFGVGRKLD